MESGIYRGGAEIYKFAEKTLPWEAFISPKSDQRVQNYGTWLDVGSRLNFTQPQASRGGGGNTYQFGDIYGLDEGQIANEIDKKVRRSVTLSGMTEGVGD